VIEPANRVTAWMWRRQALFAATAFSVVLLLTCGGC
jgi:hypothetical protein